ncbi:MAG: carbon-phosphorus lyase complex subunit PhnI [Treponema sp.]|jgi:alpha-D-ribose 1-methylphosphonate 5-triphosphate synthase subunit PhnI|nr:carbon-phosphorus lyase complex subunit PhnI [Treponema sp.]
MAYSAVRGGREAVEQAAALLERRRSEGSSPVELEALEKRMGLLIDRIMGEAGFYAPRYAALALKQSEGSPEEAVFLLRAYRSTLSRSCRSLPLDGADMRLLRRISAAFKDIPGGQFLGATYDYTHRLLDFDLEEEKAEPGAGSPGAAGPETSPEGPSGAQRVSEQLRAEGLIAVNGDGDTGDEPWDITQQPLPFPAPRSARLQALARADSGFIGGLAYAAIRGFGPSHPTVGELRTGKIEVLIPHPLIEGECIVAGDLVLTETETLFPREEAEARRDEGEDPLRILGSGQGERADKSTHSLSLGMGYGMVFGRNDTKAIAMSILDYTLSLPPAAGEESVLQNQEFVLLHGDCLEMSGFISHLKLPHYVTFQSKLDRVRHSRQRGGEAVPGGEGEGP